MRDELVLRLRSFVDEWGSVCLVVCLLVAAAGGYGAYLGYVDPGTTIDERTDARWSTSSEFTHSATVERPNPLYPVDTRLSNRSAYFTRLSPGLEGVHRFGYEASSGSLTVRSDVQLVLQSVTTDGESEQVFWRTTDTLDRTEATSVEPGQVVEVPYEVDVARLVNRSERIDSAVGGAPGTIQALLVVTVDYQGTIAGNEVSNRRLDRMRIQLGPTYQVESAAPETEATERTSQVVVPKERGPLERIGGPLALVAGLLVAGAVLALRQDPLTARERAYLAYLDDRSEFEEWIISARVPQAALDYPVAEVDSLADVANLAIDAGVPLIEHPETETFSAVHDGCVYQYRPPTLQSGGMGGEETDTESEEEPGPTETTADEGTNVTADKDQSEDTGWIDDDETRTSDDSPS